MPRHSTLRIVPTRMMLAAAILTLSLAHTVTIAAESRGPGLADASLYSAVLADERALIRDETAGLLSSYTIDAFVTGDDASRIDGVADIRYINDTGRETQDIFVRLYANSPIYAPDGIDLGEIVADGESISTEYSVNDTVVRLELPAILAEGESIDFSIPFTTNVPDSGQGYGMFGVSPSSDTVSLAHWFPILAGYGPDGEWNLDPPSTVGDPVFSNTALFEVTLTARDDLRIVTTGEDVSRESAGNRLTRHTFVTGPSRDFMLVIDDDFAVAEMEVDGTLVRSWFEPENADAGERVLRYGAQALELFNDLIGPYPFNEMDLVEVPIGNGAAGVEFPQLMLIASSLYDRPNQPGVPSFLENVVAHEVVHQWWYALVGNDQYKDAFIDEGLTNYLSTAVYFERFYSPEIGEEQVDLYLRVPYLATLFDQGDEIVDQPTDDFTQADYGVMVYGKAALGFGAFREALGDDVFFAALGDYYADYRFTVATPDNLLAAFEGAANADLGELWRHWFEAAEGDQDYSEDDLAAFLFTRTA